MAEAFKTVNGKLDFSQPNGCVLSVTLPAGSRCPDKLEDLAKYVGDRVSEALAGVSNSEAFRLKAENESLKKKIDELIAEKKGAKSADKPKLL